MKRIYLCLFAVSALLFACEESAPREASSRAQDQRPSSDRRTTVDQTPAPVVDRGAVTDRSVEEDQNPPPPPAELPTAGEASLEGADELQAPVPQGEARAGWVDAPEEALTGPSTRCRVGCLRLDNALVSVCIEGLTTDYQYSFSGGGIIDATLATEPEGDSLGVVLPTPNLGEVKIEEAGIVRDGSEGGAAIIRFTGRSQGSRLILGYLPSALVPDAPVTIEYRLAPDSDAVELFFWFGGEDQAVLRMHEILDLGDASIPLTPGLAPDAVSAGPFPYLAAYHGRGAYLFESLEGPLKLLPLPDLPFQPLRYDSIQVAPRQLVLLRRRLRIGVDVESLRPPLEGALEQRFTGPAGASLVVLEEESRAQLTQLRLNAEGLGSARLMPGRYAAILSDWPGQNEAQPFELPGAAEPLAIIAEAPGRVELSVRDEAGAPLGARLIARNAQGARHFVDGHGALALALPAGDWSLRLSAGFHYSAWSDELTLTAGETTQVERTLTLELPFEGWASGDFHQHATPSLDSETPLLDRLLSNVGAGLDFIVASDHDVVTDYRPVIATAGLGEVIGFPLFGVEVSPYAGHMGAYGVRYEPDHPEGAGGSPPLITQEDGAWRKRRIPELVAAARERGAEVLQINHPRDSSGLFDSVRYTPPGSAAEIDDPEWSADFDSVEVFNGRSSFCAVLTDWVSLLSSGLPLVGVGNSDTHSASKAPGYPRNYLPTRASPAAAISGEEVIAAFRAGQVIVSGGLLIDFPGGERPGDELQSDAGRLRLRLRLRSPSAWRAERLRALFRGEVIWERVLETDAALITDLDEEIELSIEEDGPLIFLATTTEEPEGLGGRPFSFTNPLWIDGDGDGAFTPRPLEERPAFSFPFCD